MRRVAIGAVVVLVVLVAAAVWLVRGVGQFSLQTADPWTTAATVPSSVLGRGIPIEVFAPPVAAECAAAPVLLLFHGRGGDESQWFGGGLLSPGVGVDAIAHRMIDAGTIPPVTIVSASIDDSYGVDSSPANDGYDHGMYGRYVSDELVPFVTDHYGRSGGAPMYIGGLSMGGYVALNVALDNPGRFAGVGALSPAFFVSPPADRAWMYSGNGRTSLFERADAGAADRMRIFLGVGTSDYSWIRQAATKFNGELAARGVDVTMQTVPGGHDANTWHALSELLLVALFGDTSCTGTATSSRL